MFQQMRRIWTSAPYDVRVAFIQLKETFNICLTILLFRWKAKPTVFALILALANYILVSFKFWCIMNYTYVSSLNFSCSMKFGSEVLMLNNISSFNVAAGLPSPRFIKRVTGSRPPCVYICVYHHHIRIYNNRSAFHENIVDYSSIAQQAKQCFLFREKNSMLAGFFFRRVYLHV